MVAARTRRAASRTARAWTSPDVVVAGGTSRRVGSVSESSMRGCCEGDWEVVSVLGLPAERRDGSARCSSDIDQ